MTNLKISQDGEDVFSTTKLLMDDTYPTWKCDVRKNPKMYGKVKIIGTLPAGATKNILTVAHNYGYTPSFIVAWNYPAATGSTFGIGLLSNLDLQVNYQMSTTNFSIVATGGIADITNLFVELRYYIFAEDFGLAKSPGDFFS